MEKSHFSPILLRLGNRKQVCIALGFCVYLPLSRHLYCCASAITNKFALRPASAYICTTMGKGTIWDPLRKKEVALTPEERVRQWFIGQLNSRMLVPMHMMMSETGFRLGDKEFKADILVYDRSAAPLAIVECKRPEVKIDSRVLDQAIRYNMVLEVKYIIITNGVSTYICRRGEGCGYEFVSHVPTYEEMLGIHTDNADIR